MWRRPTTRANGTKPKQAHRAQTLDNHPRTRTHRTTRHPPNLEKIPRSLNSSGCRTLADGSASSFSGDSFQFNSTYRQSRRAQRALESDSANGVRARHGQGAWRVTAVEAAHDSYSDALDRCVSVCPTGVTSARARSPKESADPKGLSCRNQRPNSGAPSGTS